MCVFNFPNCWRLNADTTNCEHWFNQEISQRQERTQRGNRDNLISRTKAWLPPSAGNSTVHLWDLTLCKRTPHRERKEKVWRNQSTGEEVMVLILTYSFQAKTNYGTAKGKISERPRDFLVWAVIPELFWQVAMEGLAAHLPRAFVSQHIPAHCCCWDPGFPCITGTAGCEWEHLWFPHSGKMGH